MGCIDCGSGSHFLCGNPCCCASNPPVAAEFEDFDEEDRDDRRYTRRSGKRDASLKDQQSTGRKRAAQAYPLNRDAPCEWQGLRFAGGGRFPIIGCFDRKQEARHHGPDKNTLNNEEGNIHRICVFCHNRWHTLNDPEYTPGNPGSSHDYRTKASIDEIANNEVYWAGKKTVKAKD